MHFVGVDIEEGKWPSTSYINLKNTYIYGNSEHSSALTIGSGFRKIEKCEIQENAASTKGDSTLEVTFKVDINKNTDSMDYTLDVTNLLKYGIKEFEKVTYEDNTIQIFCGLKEDGKRVVLFFVDTCGEYLYDVFFMDGLEDHTGIIYYRKANTDSVSTFTTVAYLEFTYLGDPLNFVYLPRFYNEGNFSIKYPGYEDIKGSKAGEIYLPDNYEIDTDDDNIKGTDMILHFLDDPHIRRFIIPIPFIVKTNEDNDKQTKIYFRSMRDVHGKQPNNYLLAQYGYKKENGLYDKDYLSLLYYWSDKDYGNENFVKIGG